MLTGDLAEVWRCLDAAQLYASDSRSQVRLANARGAAFLERNDAATMRGPHLLAALQHRRRGRICRRRTSTEASRSLGLVKSHAACRESRGEPAGLIPGAGVEHRTRRHREHHHIPATDRGRLSRLRSRLPQAIRVLQVAADLIEAVPIDELNGEQRATFLASQHTVFAELTDMFASQQGADDSTAWLAFEASERGRARSLRYALNQETQDASSSVDAPSATKYQRLLSDVVSLKATGDPGARRPASSTTSTDLPCAKVRPAILSTVRQLGRTLRQLDATLVEYASGPKEMLAFVITRESRAGRASRRQPGNSAGDRGAP